MEKRPHFLIVSFYIQSHVTPSLLLANRLVRWAGARATFSTTVSSHRCIFSTTTNPLSFGGLLSHIPYSDGFDDGYHPGMIADSDYYDTHLKLIASKSLSSIVGDLAAAGRPVTCIIYTCFSTWAAAVARHHCIPSVPFWIQPATTFAAFWHYFHGYDSLINANVGDPFFPVAFPSIPRLHVRDLPSLLTVTSDDPAAIHLHPLLDMCADMDSGRSSELKPKVLANTWSELEPEAIASVANKVEVFAIGPLPMEAAAAMAIAGSEVSIFKEDEKDYMAWLDEQPEGSVVYISFGSYCKITKEQAEEMAKGLRESQRPYLLVLRKDNRWDGRQSMPEREGMVVEWCAQSKVLAHRAVGCFVTHCGWNSATESLAHGVPMVGLPQWMDQGTNMWLVEEWGVGVRAEVSEEGIVRAAELRRCLERVMGPQGSSSDIESDSEIKRMARVWKERLQQAADGAMTKRIKGFVEEFALQEKVKLKLI
ncbi:Cyanidin 3-O-rutinoside 5-O-glucosyltransferase [Apostasia shenzhenica]|uniref:Glycosyltransferase n=1 Tax=Apostasia shenzhenica TaxID=1088818 RepID=A0A2I0BGU6_9ASPA|nr:Cyanidin 3-O-rutinoside 5-O-glucosyltransferase [Apostasia shenzhenica]